MKLKYINMLLLGASLTGLTSCNDFLDKEPESSITPAAYFSAEADLAAYSVNLYGFFTTIAPGSYGISVFGNDNATDNQAAQGYSSRWVPGEWQVGSTTSDSERGAAWNFYQIRDCNYFFQQVLPKYEAQQISGSETNIRHYIGEMYFQRAYAYFNKLQSIGDCPIITEVLADDQETLTEASKRRPRHEVARFILSDLDKAIEFLSTEAPGGKNRISKNVAYLLRSRVALFEATWLKYHKGTAFVPGGQGWPGNTADLNGFNIDTEISYFLEEAMKSAKVVGDQLVGNLVNNTDAPEGMDRNFNSLNPYYTMFCDENMEGYSEVLMWRQYDESKSVTHNIQMQLQNNGGGSGWTRGLVNSFLMRNGLPIYAAGSGYDPEWEKDGITATLQNRDSRIQIFTKKDGDIENYTSSGDINHVDLEWVVKGNNETRMVTGYAIKKGKHYNDYMQTLHHKGTTGSIVFRGTEALLNYMEACYEKSGNIDATADSYWKALRTRAKVDADYTKTIAATDMTKEAEGDFGAYSHGQLVDATLYNIRRERRNEFIGEGARWADLKRWRACDQVNGYQIEGMRYWGSVYEGTWTDNDGRDMVVVDVEGGTGNMSSESVSGVYIHPYQISHVNNSVFDGYKFTPAHYLSPLPQSTFRQTASGDQADLNSSVVYQNPGWPKVAGQGPTSVN
ncbi:RagB/SusD family nutrient uptake outer membrane protein [Bacteroides sp.]|uniref:RagB/SusD family nutrient uptake outer membrane protein n=1 Tax=Bacteroides sp. TaxID=29523 RepID=UPI0023CEEAD7|nr:RagB/SusD family nutrient uptake outer membrane protein [Bacteroides sp.]MDE5759465.1 RagB/SusD family nutrient uptake outer membrane protein [Bacteroides sp.]MDE6214995.1 RagB/SusD family nutrient uptake outer membrane protein [Bacteroides sp.]